MSYLTVSSVGQTWQLNVVSFSSPVDGQITTAQVNKMAVYFPIRFVQPQLELSVQFFSESDYDSFQAFVRRHQQQVLAAPSPATVVMLSWPERNIIAWSGVIKEFKAGGQRANFAPRASFTVDTTQNMVSSANWTLGSTAAPFSTIYGVGMGIDSVLNDPLGGLGGDLSFNTLLTTLGGLL
jgi:hypothetical protein